MAVARTQIKMASGDTISVTEGASEVEDHILKVIAGESQGVVDGWRFAYLNGSSGQVLVNIDLIESVKAISRGGRTS